MNKVKNPTLSQNVFVLGFFIIAFFFTDSIFIL